MNKDEFSRLVEKARKAMNNAFAVRSNFPAGAALLTDKGNIYIGCNVESVISGMGICAERCAIDSAVANGEYCFKAILITTKMEESVKPCGMCLQYLSEFAQVANHDDTVKLTRHNY